MSPPDPVVYKFGGSSVRDADRLRHVARLVAAGPENLVVVVSALQGVTDRLVALAAEPAGPGARALVEELRARHSGVLEGLGAGPEDAEAAGALAERFARLEREVAGTEPPAAARRDAILSAGEDLSAALLAAAVRAAGRAARVIDARTVIRTDDRFGSAVPDGAALPALAGWHLLPVVAEGTVAVVGGFVGSTADGRTTTLGRGSGDFTAALLGGALSAEVVHVWTDVVGVMSGDPRQVDAPRLLREIGFEELVELAWAGARVLHPVAAKWAVAHRVPLRIRSTFEPGNEGTLVRHDVRGAAEIAAVAAKAGVVLIEVRSRPSALPYGFLGRVFGVMGHHRLDVDLVATSHTSTAFTIDESADLAQVADELGLFAEVEVHRDLTTVTVVGRGLRDEPGMDARVFRAVERTPVHLVSQASDASLSFVVDSSVAADVVRRLHQTLIELGGDERRSA